MLTEHAYRIENNQTQTDRQTAEQQSPVYTYLKTQALQAGANDLRELVLAHLRHLALGVQVPAPPGLYTTGTAAALPRAGLRDPGGE